MKIPDEIKKSILIDKNKLSVNQISKKYNLPRIEVKKIIEASKRKLKKWFFVFLILIPVLFFIIFELSLRLFGYGYSHPQWVDAGNGKYIINAELGKKYFNNVKFVPATTEDVFDQVKKQNTFRVFVLGGSSAAGYPFMPMGSFSRYIRKRLELVYPNTNVEVVNISMTGVSSYVLLDLLPGVLEQKPDLILIYAGHNEFYGALGVGSMESLGTSRSAVKLLLYLDKFRVTQLVRNSISWILSLFKSDSGEEYSGTLMSRMAKDQYIALNSEKFNKGIDQFEGNLREILSLCKNEGVPVILGKVTSNLKDQKPFISITTPGYQTADKVYENARAELQKNNFLSADSLFRLAKDLDALRFRAPEKIDTVIDDLGDEFKIEISKVDSLFSAVSPDGIVGDNLMVDHLHPNLKGYQLIGKAFYNSMRRSGNLPTTEAPKISFDIQDSLTIDNFMFTKLDSLIGIDIVTLLKNDWPFVKKGSSNDVTYYIKHRNFIDSLAFKFIEKKITWADAHLDAATYYLRMDSIKKYLKEMDVLIYQYPSLIDLNTAIKYFYEQNKITPGDYTTKRLGIIALYRNNYEDALRYLTESNKSDPNDKQVLFNLAKVYYKRKNFSESLSTINKCLSLYPDYIEASLLKKKIIIGKQ